ncbi:ABC transporter permease [Sulfitobacter sp. M57]|uniref:ABC transporter permease n=1 Tax=unclassified Sulfitobacter TaxID=196795 RepID=UPI0023E101F9|nr:MULTISPECIES: ABC transporter permease [unclassified Sulfitobacter]MDF3413638.1 ABC transporter permease [Sulfitobacter sp. KE5]MDF3421081.1 ABC transporter permease [Sulfitobacter sp. KE43]MDF3432184.1 ABC transporter permease [Sulfitobacter sp. KE42]MDF3457823.1 ABC transporter permease [Sulfitobacter sp. S74]MDF3461724.1 ABC transporter permease [Sulfitobacter sp. Ks18]
MGIFILRRLGVMLLTALCLTFIVFWLTNLYPNLEKLAKTQGNFRMSDEAVTSYLDDRGYLQPLPVKFGQWLGVMPGWVTEKEDGTTFGRCFDADTPEADRRTRCGVIQGDWGFSTVFKDEVGSTVATRLALTGKLMLCVLLLMVPSALIVGVLAGMREGSKLDRSLSTFSIATTATPEYVSGVIFIAVLASSKFGLSPILADLGWIDGKTLFLGSATSAMKDANFWNFFLPVLTISLYGMGYIARMTRASMAEVMTAQYIRTARLKGVKFSDIVLKHALRNALIAPFTVIMLQIPWLLNGVVIVETLFNYKGFGWLLVQAAGNNDIELLLAVSVVSVAVVLVTQLISDIGYVYLNPRIRIS